MKWYQEFNHRWRSRRRGAALGWRLVAATGDSAKYLGFVNLKKNRHDIIDQREDRQMKKGHVNANPPSLSYKVTRMKYYLRGKKWRKRRTFNSIS